jgi:hypothetical protein
MPPIHPVEGSYCASTRAGMTRAHSFNMVDCKRNRGNLPGLSLLSLVLLARARWEENYVTKKNEEGFQIVSIRSKTPRLLL